MKIAIFTDVFPPSINGVSSSILLLSKELVRRGHFVRVFTPKIRKGQLTKAQLEGVNVSYSSSIPSLFYPDVKLAIPVYPKTVYQLMKDKIDIVHFHTPLPIGADGILAAKLLGLPIVGTFHTYFMEPEYLKVMGLDRAGKGMTNLLVKLGWKYSNLYYNAANLVTSPSIYTQKMLIKNNIKTKSIVIPNGISVPISTPKDLAQHERGKTCLYVGRISKEKNITILVEAFDLVHKKIPAAKLTIVGNGPDLKKITKLVEKKNLQNIITLTGKIPYEKLLESPLYRESTLFVTASTSENQPMSLLEAMSFGLPIVAVGKRGIPELINNNGLLCKNGTPKELATHMITILENPKKAQAMSQAALRNAKKFTISHVATQFEKIYQDLMTKNSKQKRNSFASELSKWF